MEIEVVALQRTDHRVYNKLEHRNFYIANILIEHCYLSK